MTERRENRPTSPVTPNITADPSTSDTLADARRSPARRRVFASDGMTGPDSVVHSVTAMFGRKRPKPVEIRSIDELEPMMRDGKPILIDFFQFGCAPCKVMDGIVNELAEEFADGAHIVKVNVGRVPGAAQMFKVRSTPTFVLLGRSQKRASKKARRRDPQPRADAPPTARWRASGLVRKDIMTRVLESNGAIRRP